MDEYELNRWGVVARALVERRSAQRGSEIAAAEQCELARRSGARLLLAADDEYPAQLKAVPAPPPFLLVRGALRAEDALAVAIVGARRATPYGLGVAEHLAAELARRGVTIVSGFAYGIDSAAHRGALAVGGRTVAVLGSGVDVIYPPKNRTLASRVLERGALVSQFPMRTAPLSPHFPHRNRTIAGLTLGTVVVEAAEKSGALITARYAGELGREVFAVPGPTTSAVSRGANRLVQDGAKLVQGWEDVVAELADVWRRCLKEPSRPESRTATPEGEEGRVLTLVGGAPVHIDELIERSGVSAGRMAALLMTLELNGWVRQLAGQRYGRV